jgi:hypothetical protein
MLIKVGIVGVSVLFMVGDSEYVVARPYIQQQARKIIICLPLYADA